MDRDYTKEQGSLTEKRSQGTTYPLIAAPLNRRAKGFSKVFLCSELPFLLVLLYNRKRGAFLGRAVRGSSRTVREPSPSTEGLRSTLIY